MTDTLKQTFLSLLLERIEIEHCPQTIRAKIIWRTGLVQTILIDRPKLDINFKWSEEDEDILRKNYPSMPREELCTLLHGRKWRTIVRRASEMGIKRMPSASIPKFTGRRFSQEEDQIIQSHYAGKITRDEMFQKLSHRNPVVVAGRAGKLGLKNAIIPIKWKIIESGTSAELTPEIESVHSS